MCSKSTTNCPKSSGCYFPGIVGIWFVVAKPGGHRTRHNGGAFDAGIPQVERDRLGKAHQTKFTGIISEGSREKIGSGQAGNTGKIALGLDKRLYGSLEAIKYPRQVGVMVSCPSSPSLRLNSPGVIPTYFLKSPKKADLE